jgi:hypothetical protein
MSNRCPGAGRCCVVEDKLLNHCVYFRSIAGVFPPPRPPCRGLRVYRDRPLFRPARAPFVYLPDTLQRTSRR